ncbi:MAG TPA: hypothetical protein VK550_01495 [Polyangiaceae bacterium]|nr:hypothetical protein [Polyangiaceae bacterium]
MKTLSVVRACLVVAALNGWAFSAQAAPVAPAPTGGDAESQKLVTAAMEVDYLKMSFDAAKKKLSQAALNCRRKGCSSGLHASIHGYFAIIHWLGEDARELAIEDLKNMLKLDLEQKLDVRYSTEEIEEEWEAKHVEMRKVVMEERRVAAAREAEERKAAAAREAEERRLAAIRAAEDAKRAEEDKKAAAVKAEVDRKEAARKAEEDKKAAAAKALEERRAAAAKQAEINKQQAIKEAEDKLSKDASRHAEEEKQTLEAQRAEAWRRLQEEKKEATRKAEEDRKRIEDDKKESARRAVEEKKETARRAEEDKKRAEDDKRDAARRAAEEKKEAALKAAEDAKKAAEEKKEAARKVEEDKKAAALKVIEDAKKAAEEKKEAALKAAEEKKEAALKAADDAKKAAEEKKEAARKAAEEKKEAALKAAEEKKEAALKAADDAKKAAEEKKEAARKTADDARKAEEERRLRVPPPVGKLVENPFKEQAVGYPIPILVKIPPAPPKIEKPRVEVVKVVAEYSAPGFEGQRQLELKPEKEGAWVGMLPCDVTSKDGEVTYSISAFNKYDNAVARSGSNAKPNKVTVKADLVSSLPHWPGELPPESCEVTQSKAKAAAQAKCATTEQGCSTAPPPLCEGNDCGNDEVPAALAANQPKRFGCVSCRVGGDARDPAWVPAGWMALGLGLLFRSSARRRLRDGK